MFFDFLVWIDLISGLQFWISGFGFMPDLQLVWVRVNMYIPL